MKPKRGFILLTTNVIGLGNILNIKNSKILLLGISLSLVMYFILRLFIDLPPKINPNIDYFKTKKLKEFSKEESERIAKANENSGYFDKICLSKYLSARDEKILQYCMENNLAKDSGGGCYHFMGSYNRNDMFNALEYCKITY